MQLINPFHNYTSEVLLVYDFKEVSNEKWIEVRSDPMIFNHSFSLTFNKSLGLILRYGTCHEILRASPQSVQVTP